MGGSARRDGDAGELLALSAVHPNQWGNSGSQAAKCNPVRGSGIYGASCTQKALSPLVGRDASHALFPSGRFCSRDAAPGMWVLTLAGEIQESFLQKQHLS